jgi:hypothetical protein
VVGTYQDDQLVSCIYESGDRLTQEGEVRRTLEEGGTARLAGIQVDGSQEVPLAYLVARMASGVSRTLGVPLSEQEVAE